MMMSLKDFYYDLPDDFIAQRPVKDRSSSKLLILDRSSETIRHDVFSNIGSYLPERSQIFFNNSKVIPARFLGRKESTSDFSENSHSDFSENSHSDFSENSQGAVIEVFVLKKLNEYCYESMIRPLKRLKDGDCIRFDDDLTAIVLDREKRIVRFNKNNIFDHMERIGHIPLPPYIKREDTLDDRNDYQTVYAKRKGSLAAPTAGLHFTKDLIYSLKDKGHAIRYVTLHVGYGTFKPIEVEDITQHRMHTESYEMTETMKSNLLKGREEGRSIVCVGTTTCRVLESFGKTGQLNGDTNIFIYPGFSFKMTDILVTNFHMPESTLLILVSAFASKDFIMRAYQEAIRNNYRFFSYGDAMVIL